MALIADARSGLGQATAGRLDFAISSASIRESHVTARVIHTIPTKTVEMISSDFRLSHTTRS